jgi:hypothetical protein
MSTRTELASLDGDGVVVRVALQYFDFGAPKIIVEADSGSHVSGFTLDEHEAQEAAEALLNARDRLIAAKAKS